MDTGQLRAFALEQMEKHGLLADGWRFRFDTARRRFGVCRFDRKEISVSRLLAELNSEDECRDTVLHEIAHALAGPRAGHGPRWRAMCRKVGAKPERCYTGDEVKEPEPKYVARCPSCEAEITFQRRPSKPRACGRCCKKFSGGVYDERFLMQLIETRTGRAVRYAGAATYIEGRCPKCGRVYTMRRRPRRSVACTDCCKRYAGGSYDDRFRLELWRVHHD